jgi:integrase
MPTIKITEAVRAKALRRPLIVTIYHDTEIKRFALIVRSERAFWAQEYQLRGVNPRTGKRFGGGTRYEIGDAFNMPLADARAAALKVKAAVREGRDPHGERIAKREELTRARSIIPTTTCEALDIFEKMLVAKAGAKPSPRTRAETIRYGRKAIRLMKAEAVAIGSVSTLMVRLMLDEFPNSQTEKRLTFSGLNQFLTWCRRREMIERNPVDDLDRGERPKPGAARKNAPTIETLRRIWAAVEPEPEYVRDMIRFGLLTALRRDEFAELPWSEVDMAKGKITIAAERMKNREEHTLPLSDAAFAILSNRARHGPLVFPTQAGKAHHNWTLLLRRIRERIGESDRPAPQSFRLHDIRRSFNSILCDEGFGEDALDLMLAHKRTGMKAIYNLAKLMPERERAFARWARLLTEPENAEAAEGVRNVLPFAARSAM